ncbi:MAG: hypothetical protein QOJ73_1339 [Streptosporangiaceae bacterium]|jgi:hypothetical protein|nr:hypothetical protein [Streptosporangiaceae bacterium]
MNNPSATFVLPDMSIHRRSSKPGAPGGREDHTKDPACGRRRCWRLRRRRNRGLARRTPVADSHGGQSAAGTMQLAIGLLTASLDSPELEAWAVWALIPEEPAALGDFVAGLHVVSQLLLHELYDATGQPPAATLQKLAILAEIQPETPTDG